MTFFRFVYIAMVFIISLDGGRYLFATPTVHSVIINSNEEKNPTVSIITSIWNADEFIEGFLADITRQTIFSDCELIMINANSPGNEEAIIKKYIERYPNIRYVKLDRDPGLYAVWNQAIKMAKGKYITNANSDDRRHPALIELHVKALDASPEIDLVYSGYLLTQHPNETFENNHYIWEVHSLMEEFAPERMNKCLPGPQPMWRKSMHERCGYFDESFRSSGDWEMWNRAASKGSVFKKITGIYGLVYLNPTGISTDKDEKKALERKQEDDRIIAQYKKLWKWE